MGIRAAKLAPAVLAVVALAACAVSMPEKEVAALSEVGPGSVLIVGSVDVVPPLRAWEKDLDIPYDVFTFGMEEKLSNRAVLTFGRSPDTRVDHGEATINPELGQTYFFAVPRDAPYMVGGYVVIEYAMVNGMLRDRRIVIPGTLRLEILPDDEAIYVGTLRLTRDDFNEVIEAMMVDDYQRAAAEFETRFGTDTRLRKAIFEPVSQ
jgi:hypothetical protein